MMLSMRRKLPESITAGLFALACTHAIASGIGSLPDEAREVVARGQSTILLNIDNDTLLLNNRDGFYTSGVGLSQRHTLRDDTQSTSFGWRIGQELYTASDIKLPPESIGPPDHPYAGWLFGGIFRSTHQMDGSYQEIGLDIGCLGPCAGGEWTQTNLHRLLRQPLPQGWRKQVKNEFGVVLHADLAPVRWKPYAWFDATPNLHGRFGNIHTDAGVGIVLRAGRLNALPEAPTLHAFVHVDANAVAYDATLQGGYFSSGNPHTVKPKRFVGDMEIGFAWNRGPYGISASVVRRSNEIRALPNTAGMQNFARFLVSYSP